MGVYYGLAPAISVTNGMPSYEYDIIGSLPAGITYNSTTNTLSGTPTQYGNFPIILTAEDSNEAYDSKELVLFIDTNGSASVSPPPPPSPTNTACVDDCIIKHAGKGKSLDQCIKNVHRNN
jgi:hypothetical protein